MKTSKRILGVILTLVMLVNVFAVSVFAAYPDDSACALIVTTDKTNYAPGDEVILTISTKATSEVGPMLLTGQYELGYNSAGLEPYVEGNYTLEGHGFAADPYFSAAYDSSMSQVIYSETTIANGGTVTADMGWDEVILYCVADNNSIDKDCANEAATLFTVKMKIPADAQDGTYTIGFNRDGYETNYTAYATDRNTGGLYGNDGSAYGKTYLYDFGVATYTVGNSAPAPTVTVDNISTQVQWQSKDAGLMRVAFRGNIKGYTPSFATGSTTEIADITEMGVVYSKSNANPTVGGANCTAAPAWTIYDFTTGGYFFRAVVGNYPYDNGETLYANAYIVINGQTITAANGATQTTGAAEYARAVALGMAAK
ncbi:MAG: hypothetical protein E7557_06115 [Ruminococcaceae bacterium]|nr:hypothetical protein [Oscillospiraceae bacterium]